LDILLSFEVHLVIQAVISSRSHLALQTSLNGELLFLIISATVAANAGQMFPQIIDICHQSAYFLLFGEHGLR